MSELMVNAVIRMPFDMAMEGFIARRQYYDYANSLLNDYAAMQAENEALQAKLEALQAEQPSVLATVENCELFRKQAENAAKL